MIKKTGHHLVSEGNSNIFLTCEHASKNIPQKYENLGLSISELENCKDLYDPGAAEITQILAKELGANALVADISRLVIDYNRKLNSKTKNNNKHHSCALKTELLVEENGVEKMVKIPGNISTNDNKFEAEEQERYTEYVMPYINEGYVVIEKLRKKHKKTYVMQIHSFYPKYNGEERTVDIGVLYYPEKSANAEKLLNNLQEKTDLCVAGNRPWSMQDIDGVVFEEVEKMQDVEVIGFDINNKHLKTKKGIEKIVKLLLSAIQEELAA